MSAFMKHAFLILAHQYPNLLLRLVDALMSPYSNIYIHIDRKSVEMANCEIVKMLALRENVWIVPSIKTYWGGFSLIQAELILLREAAKNKENRYFHLISGADFPTKPVMDIIQQFENDIHDYILWDEKETDRRYLIDSFYFYDLYGGKSKLGVWNDYVKRPFLVQIQRLSHLLVRGLRVPIRRKIPGNYYHAFGAQWFSITQDTMRYILKYLDENAWIEKRFRHTAMSDETFFVMIIMNGPRRDYAINDNLRYFGNGHIKQDALGLDMEDLKPIKAGNYIFCRKILPEISNELIGNIIECKKV